MKIDRSLFLTLSVALSTLACSAAREETGSGTDDMVAAPACTGDAKEAPSPIAEGVCSDLTDKAQHADFEHLTAITESGKPLFEQLGCVPSETGEGELEEGAEGTPPCDTHVAEFVFTACHAFADRYKPAAAKEAVKCLRDLADISDLIEVAKCGPSALERTNAVACTDPSAVEATCHAIEQARIAAGDGLSDADKTACRALVGGLRPDAREELVRLSEREVFISLRFTIQEIGFPSVEGR